MAKKIYLGGPSSETDLVIADAQKLEDAGHTITEKWWERVHTARARGYARDADVPDDYMLESAERNENGLLAADAVVLRMRTRPTKIEQVLLDILAEADADGGRVGAMRGADMALRDPGGPSGGLAYELGWIKGFDLSGIGATRPIFIVGDPQRFIGSWTHPKPIRVASIEDALLSIGCRHREQHTVGPNGQCVTCKLRGPFPGERVRDLTGRVGLVVESVQNTREVVRYDVPDGAGGVLRLTELRHLLRGA